MKIYRLPLVYALEFRHGNIARHHQDNIMTTITLILLIKAFVLVVAAFGLSSINKR